jgi:hypothetical protein
MMTFQSVSKYLTAKPFRPFRITTASRRTFDVRHPEIVELRRTTMTISTSDAELPDEKSHWYELSLMLIESIEPLELQSQGTNN